MGDGLSKIIHKAHSVESIRGSRSILASSGAAARSDRGCGWSNHFRDVYQPDAVPRSGENELGSREGTQR